MPTYRIDRDGKPPRIVDAPTPASARNHVAADEIRATKITASEAFKLAGTGATLETAGEGAAEPVAE